MRSTTAPAQRKRGQTDSIRSAAARRNDKQEHILAARFDKDTYRQFKMIAAAHLVGTDDLLAYGISLAFSKLGQPVPVGITLKLKSAGLVD